MKTSRKWIEDPATRFLNAHEREIEAVQLDAMRYGMRLAADIAEQAGYSRTPKQTRQKILHEAHLAELPKETL